MEINGKSLGEIAYNGYYERAGGRTWNNYPMPLWADLPMHVQQQWQAGAEAVAGQVRAQVLHGVVDMMQTAIAEQEAEKAVNS